MVSLFEYVLNDLKNGIDRLVYQYDNPRTHRDIIWDPLAKSMSKLYNLKKLDQVEVLEKMIVESNESGLFAKKYVKLIANRFG